MEESNSTYIHLHLLRYIIEFSRNRSRFVLMPRIVSFPEIREFNYS